MKKEPKILVTESERIDEKILEGTIDKVIESFKKLKSAGWTRIGTEWNGGGESYDIVVYKKREETDIEYKLRLDKLKDEELREEREKIKRKKQYELLKKEFEGE